MPLSAEERQRFARDGFLVKQAFYSPDEVDVLSRVSRGAARREDGGRGGTAQDEGRQSEFWMIGGGVEERGIYNAVCFGERMVSAVSALLEDEVTLYHRKLVMKDKESFVDEGQHSGNAWEWHQDYGYWYHDSQRIRPDLASCMVAIDHAHAGNGCLNVLRGSHLLGRVDHSRQERGEMHADADRVSLAMEVCERVLVELAPGSVVFFHCNTLHCSAPNHSDDPRWALICCYNALSNTVAPPAPGSAISAWDDGCVLEYGREQLRKEEVQQARI